MRVKIYDLLSDKIEEGIRGGLNKCVKRDYVVVSDFQDENAVEEIHNYIMNAICEVFDWDDEARGE